MAVDRRDGRALGLLGAFALACGLGFAVVYLVTVRTAQGRLLADASLQGAVLSHSGVSDLVDRALGVVTGASVLAALAVIAMIALVRLRRVLGLAATGLLVVANGSALLLKSLLLDRPDLGLDESAPATLNSLPSGHSTAAFSVVVALLVVLPARTRGVVAAVGGGYAWLVAVATMTAGWHRTADSVAAFLLVGVCLAVALAAVVAFDGAEATGSAATRGGGAGPLRGRRRGAVRAAAVALALALVLAALLLTAAAVRESSFGQAMAFVAGALFILAATVAVLVPVLGLLERVVAGDARGADAGGAGRADQDDPRP